jgi:hypothetical protein
LVRKVIGRDLLEDLDVDERIIFIRIWELDKSRDSAVGIATGYRMEDQRVGVRVPVRARIFTSPCSPDRLWDPPNLISNGYRG